MTKWEYKITKGESHTNLEKGLNDIGAEGWENYLISFTRSGAISRMFWKRQVSEGLIQC